SSAARSATAPSPATAATSGRPPASCSTSPTNAGACPCRPRSYHFSESFHERRHRRSDPRRAAGGAGGGEMSAMRKWRGGFIRKEKSGRDAYIIRRRIAGTRYCVSTRCSTLAAALQELARFELAPHDYAPGGSRKLMDPVPNVP